MISYYEGTNTSHIQVSLVTFAAYTFINPEEHLTADKAFVALSLFNILQYPLVVLPTLISNVVQVSVSIKRLTIFLREDELDPNSVDTSEKEASGIHNKGIKTLFFYINSHNFFCR